MLVIKELKDCLFLLNIVQVIIKILLILIQDIFFQELKLKITILKLMEETFMISQLMTQLSNTTKFRKILTGQGDDYTTGCFFWISLILKNITD